MDRFKWEPLQKGTHYLVCLCFRFPDFKCILILANFSLFSLMVFSAPRPEGLNSLFICRSEKYVFMNTFASLRVLGGVAQ